MKCMAYSKCNSTETCTTRTVFPAPVFTTLINAQQYAEKVSHPDRTIDVKTTDRNSFTAPKYSFHCFKLPRNSQSPNTVL